MNDAMINIIVDRLNALNLRRNFFHRKLGDCYETGRVNQISYRGVANLMHLILCTETRARY